MAERVFVDVELSGQGLVEPAVRGVARAGSQPRELTDISEVLAGIGDWRSIAARNGIVGSEIERFALSLDDARRRLAAALPE